MSENSNPQQVKVWDPLVRLSHWSLVIAFLVCYFTQEQEYELHLTSGYVVLGIILFRILWGFVGTRFARFSNFVYSPMTILRYLEGFMRNRSPAYIGHNPAGGFMILLLLLGNLVIAISGIALDAAENRAGPLGDTDAFMYLSYIEHTHVWATDITVGLIVLHILGVATAGVVHRENLARAMITGKKRLRSL
jgi:cytochrome b